MSDHLKPMTRPTAQPVVGSVVTVRGAVEGFLAHKRALGRKYHSEEHELRLLVSFADHHGAGRIDQLTSALLEDFLASRPRSRPGSFNHLLSVVRSLLDWAVTHELVPASALQARRRRAAGARIPFLFDVSQARRLLAAASALPDHYRAAQRGPTYHAIFALCYGLGLRAGESCRLRLGDVDHDRQLLVVRGGKFGKSRLVPYGPRIGDQICEQISRRRAGAGRAGLDDQAPLFSFDGRTCVHPGTASHTFHDLVGTLDLDVPDGVSPPCLHSLRHSFAVGCLLRWYREGVDPQTRLLQLSTFMGHVEPACTAVYLTITPQLLDQANQRFEAFTEPVWRPR
jgi:integrase